MDIFQTENEDENTEENRKMIKIILQMIKSEADDNKIRTKMRKQKRV